MLDKCNTRWADGRNHVVGNTITTADFDLLTLFTSIISNSHLRNPEVSTRVKAHYETLEHVNRVVSNVRQPVQNVVDQIQPSWI